MTGSRKGSVNGIDTLLGGTHSGTARKLHVEFSAAIYHVMNRGNRREPIFKDDADRERFLVTLGGACAKTSSRVHAFCPMPSHFYFVVETPQANLKWT